MNFKATFDDIYDRAGYSFHINYQPPTKPALKKETSNGLLRISGEIAGALM
ncbi:hypothetical protein D0962_30480 [Leptolyngbyaceae cyanobacterium CCMR0082]|uniref:Uncharacterized protein n=2 Tax=Adonisia turfae TaxID=2950184 RepID=A0A6M0SEU7_9CYAN|nr:hypothetical protein [Adonisia turfae CCMR0081]NEZ67028.1 hypothetical protein [Adonisia turfae CCMR0082]